MLKVLSKLPKIRLPSINISRDKAQDTAQEIAFWAGLTMVSKGLYMIWPPLMWIIFGLGLIWFSLPGKKVVK